MSSKMHTMCISPPVGTGFVNRTYIYVFMSKLVNFSWLKLDDGQRVKQNLGERLSDVLPVPAWPLHEQTFDISSVLWLFIHVRLFRSYLEYSSKV